MVKDDIKSGDEKDIPIYSMEELRKKYEEHVEDLRRMCYVDGDAIVFRVGTGYEIEFVTCNTTPKILSWVYHLCEKNWITPDLIRRFIILASDHHGIDFHKGDVVGSKK